MHPRCDSLPRMRIVKAAASYFGIIFALGFVLGTVRMLWGAEALGESGFILLEIPVMLATSWVVARWLVRRFAIASGRPALAMGMFAFAMLMAAELVLTAALGESPAAWLASLTGPPEVYGFLGQIAFALMPWLAAPRGKGGA